MSTEQNKEIASKYWLTFCNPNAQEASDFVAVLKSGGSKHPNRKESSTFPNGLELTPISIIAEGDHVVLEGESQSTVANGNNYNHYSIHFELEDGKFDEVREYMGTKHQYDAASDSAPHAIRSTPSVSSLTFGVNPPSDSKAPWHPASLLRTRR
ncbi:nuclear transport factor 2 family protein [Nocardia salmonicida]|uniref:nuclear transport factor 2 family protein n=1 Tax=Nocardia salmonicida TaxID=53431 RepID=UPI00340F58D9